MLLSSRVIFISKDVSCRCKFDELRGPEILEIFKGNILFL